VRPTDEDQPGSRRPNLMSSSRRSSSDVSILAMLDGLGTRPRARRTLLWCAMGGTLACALVGTLAWMAHDPAPATEPPVVALALPAPAATAAANEAAQVSAQTASPVVAQVTPPAPPRPDPAPAALSAAPGGATIVNLPTLSGADATPALAATALPAAAHAAPHAVPAPKHPPVPALRTEPVRQTGRANVAAIRGAAHPAAKRHAGASRAVTAPAVVDTDVALITAIMQHAANGRDGVDDSGCSDKSCTAHTPARP